MRAGLEQAVPAAQKEIREAQARFGTHVNGWLLNVDAMGDYGNWYLKRATVELIVLGTNLADDAIYPISFVDAHDRPFDGKERYVWHMTKDQIPPVNAFWSLTPYDAEGFQAVSELDRFAIGDRDDLSFNDDGSLDIFVQHERLDGGTSKWLPAPADALNLCARLYWPKPEMLDGTWTPPAVQRVAQVWQPSGRAGAKANATTVVRLSMILSVKFSPAMWSTKQREQSFSAAWRIQGRVTAGGFHQFFEILDAANRYAILWRLQTAAKHETREKRLRKSIDMLERQEKPHP